MMVAKMAKPHRLVTVTGIQKGSVLFFLLALAAVSGRAQSAHGTVPEGMFVIDPDRQATWNGRMFSASEKEVAVKEFQPAELEHWNHEFPAKHSGLGGKIAELKEVDLTPVDGASKWNSTREFGEKEFEAKEIAHIERSPIFGSLVENEKWARAARKEDKEPDDKADFIAQVGIRPLAQPELEEMLNEHSRPPGERQGSLSRRQK